MTILWRRKCGYCESHAANERGVLALSIISGPPRLRVPLLYKPCRKEWCEGSSHLIWFSCSSSWFCCCCFCLLFPNLWKPKAYKQLYGSKEAPYYICSRFHLCLNPRGKNAKLGISSRWRFQILKKLAVVQRRLEDETRKFGIILIDEGQISTLKAFLEGMTKGWRSKSQLWNIFTVVILPFLTFIPDCHLVW